MKGNRLFLPVCLYPRSLYRRKKAVRQLLEALVRDRSEAMLLIADFLHVYNLLLMRKAWSLESAVRRSQNSGDNLARMMRKLIQSSGGGAQIWLYRWQELSVEPEYRKIRKVIGAWCTEEGEVGAAVSEFVVFNLRRMSVKETPRQLGWEEEYIVSEIAMSVFVTELLGFNIEIWEIGPPPFCPDPFRVLYETRGSELRSLLGVTELTRERRLMGELFELEQRKPAAG